MNKYSEQIDTILSNNGVDDKIFVGAKALAMAVAVLSAKTLAPRVLPDSFLIVKSPEDVDGAVSRVVADEGFALATLRSVALYLRAAYDDKLGHLDVSEVQGFYDAYQRSSVEDRRIALVGTLRMFHDLMDEEVARIGGDEADRLLAETKGSFESFIAQTANEPSSVLLFNMDQSIAFAINLSQNILKLHEGDRAMEINEARDANRILGAFSGMMFDQLTDNLAGMVSQEQFKQVLPEEDFEKVNALLELAYGNDDGSQQTIQ